MTHRHLKEMIVKLPSEDLDVGTPLYSREFREFAIKPVFHLTNFILLFTNLHCIIQNIKTIDFAWKSGRLQKQTLWEEYRKIFDADSILPELTRKLLRQVEYLEVFLEINSYYMIYYPSSLRLTKTLPKQKFAILILDLFWFWFVYIYYHFAVSIDGGNTDV